MSEHFCSGCVEDVKWFIENDLIRVDADSGDMPRSVEWVIRDDSEKIMRTGWANLNTLHLRVHQLDGGGLITPHGEERMIRRRNYLRWEELLDLDLPEDVKVIIMDRWDFGRASGAEPKASMPHATLPPQPQATLTARVDARQSLTI